MVAFGLAVALVLALAGSATAATLKVGQSGGKFSVKKLTIKVGDTVVFTNGSKKTHNVYSRSKGHKFDLGAQKPGSTGSRTFSSPGKIKVRCAIHPKMRMTITVK